VSLFAQALPHAMELLDIEPRRLLRLTPGETYDWIDARRKREMRWLENLAAATAAIMNSNGLMKPAMTADRLLGREIFFRHRSRN